MMKRVGVLGFCWLVSIHLGLCIGAPLAFLRFPVKNGDFSTYQGWGRPANWSPAKERGNLNFKIDIASPDAINPPSAAVIETVESGRGYFQQTLCLMKGDYRLIAEISGKPGGKAEIQCITSSGLVDVTEAEKSIQVDFSAPGGEVTILLFSDSPTGSVVKFRNVQLAIKKVESSPVPCEKGAFLGGLALPIDPTPAERYAAYELQRYIFKMTGKVPGLKGRDKIHEGKLVCIGRSGHEEPLEKLKGRPADSYLVATQGDRIFLVGNTDTGTLYAVYDFLKRQGCRWVMPGDLGEVVPRNPSLAEVKTKQETPDYDVRGFLAYAQEFFPGPGAGWIYLNADDYIDWAVRNRFNALWSSGDTWDFGAYRGYGWIQMTNHSWNSLIAPYQEYFKDHPEWYPLVNGKRTPTHPCGLPSQLCVSNKALREYTVKLALDYFRKNPRLKVFPMNPMDGYVYWCECEECKKLDGPGVDWSLNGKAEIGKFSMTDRALNYANYVAERVSKVYPDRMIEMHAYCLTTAPPVRERVHPNVMIKYANLTQSQPSVLDNRRPNVSVMDPRSPKSREWRSNLEGWRKAGARYVAYYNYADWIHPDAPLFWFYNISDELKHLNQSFGVKYLLGETETPIEADPIWYQVMAQTLWDVNTDYKKVIRETCEAFYGSAAAEMIAYNTQMADAIMRSDPIVFRNTSANARLEFSRSDLDRGRQLLTKAMEKAKGDSVLKRRIVRAQFGHAYLTVVRASNEKTKAWAKIARDAFDTTNTLRSRWYSVCPNFLMVKKPTADQLRVFYFPPVVDESETVLDLPLEWEFKKDPSDVGFKEEWYRQKSPDGSWAKIRTDKAWTEQGYDYHGAAWYRVHFKLPEKARGTRGLAFYFGAVDGYADVYLDGVKIGEQKQDADIMWDKPFLMDLPSALNVSDAHHLVVRVQKDRSAAGIWRPVKIVLQKSG